MNGDESKLHITIVENPYFRRKFNLSLTRGVIAVHLSIYRIQLVSDGGTGIANFPY